MAESGKIFTRAYDKNLLSVLRATDLVNPEFDTLNINASVEELLALKKNVRQNVTAVVDNGSLVGIISLNELCSLLTAEANAGLNTASLMKAPRSIISPRDEITAVIKHFDESDITEIPVVDSGRVIGFLLKINVPDKYRKLLQEYS